MQVRSDDVYWTRRHQRHFSALDPLVKDCRCDVAIVGAGISGALVADHLAQQGMQVVVLDRSQPGAGSTAACTALIQYELDQPLIAIAKKYGNEYAARVYRTCHQSLDWMAEYVRRLKNPCELAERRTLHLARKRRDQSEMQKEVAARRSAGIDATWIDRADLIEQYGIDRPGAIYSPRSFELDPYALTQAALKQAVKYGAKVYSPVEILSIDPGSDGVKLKSSHGPEIFAKKVILATGYETDQFIEETAGDLMTTWAGISEPIDVEKYWLKRQLLWEWGDAYLYARLTPDNRIIFGGGDRAFTNPAKRDAMIETKSKQLKKQIEKLFPGLKLQIAHQWAGEFASPSDGMPYIGICPRCPNLYLALGYGGNGVTFSLIAARILTGILCDIPRMREPAELFRFDR